MAARRYPRVFGSAAAKAQSRAAFAVSGYTPTPTPTDTTPDAFSFVDQTNVARSTEITSAPVTITGINQPASWSVTGGTAQVGSGPFAGTGTVAAGETMRVRLTSSASYSTVATATLTVGGVSDAFSVTTLEEPVVTQPPTPTPTPSARDLAWTNLLRGTGAVSQINSPLNYRGRSLHTVAFRSNRIRVGFFAFSRPGGEIDIPAPYQVTECVLEVNGGYIPVTFNGGNIGATVDPANGGFMYSDYVDPANLIGGTPLSVIPRDAEVYVKWKCFLPAGTSLPKGSFNRSFGQTMQLYDPAEEAAAGVVYSAGAFSGSPASAATPSDNVGMPIMLIATPLDADAKGVMIVGDSIAESFADNQWGSSGLSNKAGNGCFDRATLDANGANAFSMARSTKSGERMDQWLSRAVRTLEQLDHVNVIICEYGTNDIASGASAVRTLAQMQADRLQFWALCRARGIQRILECPILPRTNTDNTAPVNSRYDTGGQRDQFNAWVASKVGASDGPDALVDWLPVAQSAGDPRLWSVPVSDGTHPGSGLHGMLAAPIRAAIQAITVNNSTGTPAPSDTTPNAFAFTDQTGAAHSAVIESNAVTITGIDAAAPISITGGEYQINGGAWTSASGTVTNGQTVKVRLTTSASYSTIANATLTIGGVSDTFSVTTAADTSTPPPTGPVLSTTPYMQNGFGGPSGVLLSSYVGEDGYGWIKRAHASGQMNINAGVLTAGSTSAQYQSLAPAKANMRVEVVLDNPGSGASNAFSLIARAPGDNANADTVDDDGYQVVYSSSAGTWTLQRRDNGTSVTLNRDSDGQPAVYNDAWPAGQSRVAALICLGDKISMEIDGVVRATATDATYASGRIDIRNFGATSAAAGKVPTSIIAWEYLP